MSEGLPSNKNTNEEVDLLVFFNLIGNAFNKVFVFFTSIFKGLYGLLMRFLQQIFLNIKTIAIVGFVAVGLGFFVDSYKDKVYFSEMFVVPNFESKYELINNIEYYNSLISVKDYSELSSQFEIDSLEAKSLLSFEIEIGPEAKNDQILRFNGFMKNVDSVTRSKIKMEDYLENRNLYNSKIFLLRARSKNYKIFKKLEGGLSRSINSNLSQLAKKQRDSVLVLERENLEASLVEIRNMKNMYLTVLEKESDKSTVSSNLANTLGLQVEKTETKESQLLTQELSVTNQLNSIRKELVVNNAIFEKKSSFKEKGLIENIWYKKYKFILPIIAFLLLGLFNYMIMLYKHVINYK